MKINSSYLAAGVLIAALTLYFGGRTLLRADVEAPDSRASSAAELEDETPFAVRAETFTAQEWREELFLRGETKALRNVLARAEIGGVVVETPAQEGLPVKAGDALCRLAPNARDAALEEARAALEQRRLEHDAAVRLHEKGYRAETAVLAAKASLDAAEAQFERAKWNVEKLDIAAPFDGLFDERFVEIGDLLNPGDACGRVIQTSPFLIVGQVSEQNVSKLKVGARGVATLLSGETLEGRVRFVGANADPETRTFRFELQIDNEEPLRDGATARVSIEVGSKIAHHIPSSALTLNDDGAFGVRLIDDDGRARFAPVTLLQDAADGVWVDGLPETVRIVTVGQYYIRDGEKVDIADAAIAAQAEQTQGERTQGERGQ
ncbi:MAG: multidrug efflux RND transporter periplasmic adaptor subunit VmeJ [Parvularculaceae bacterium]